MARSANADQIRSNQINSCARVGVEGLGALKTNGGGQARGSCAWLMECARCRRSLEFRLLPRGIGVIAQGQGGRERLDSSAEPGLAQHASSKADVGDVGGEKGAQIAMQVGEVGTGAAAETETRRQLGPAPHILRHASKFHYHSKANRHPF